MKNEPSNGCCIIEEGFALVFLLKVLSEKDDGYTKLARLTTLHLEGNEKYAKLALSLLGDLSEFAFIVNLNQRSTRTKYANLNNN